MVVMAACAMVACEPVLIDGPSPAEPLSQAELASGLSFSQYLDAECTTPMPDGNYIKFESKNGIVEFYNYKADGSENILAAGAAGVFNVTPKRGQDPMQKVYGRVANQDGSLTYWEGTFTVYVPQSLAPEVKVLTGESGLKAWKWNPINGSCWGNAGYIGAAGHGANVAAGEIPGLWWGCTPEQLETEQIAHSGGVATGDGNDNAYMIFNEDGDCISYRADGTQIRKGAYTLKNYDPECSDGYLYGILETSAPAILWPFAINTGGSQATVFEVVYIDENNMSLISNFSGQSAWAWGECTWWRFKNASDGQGALAGGGKRAWTYYEINGACWGNAGYIGDPGHGSNLAAGEIPGFWWGCTPEQLETEQIAHSGGVATGDGSSDAYMVFDSDNGVVTSYKPDGSKIRESPYELVDFDFTYPDGYKMGMLKTSATGGILWPFAINTGGAICSEFEVMYLDGNLMTIIGNYGGQAAWSWGECTWWRFKPKM